MHRIASYGEIQESNKSARHGQATSSFPPKELNNVALVDLGRAFEAVLAWTVCAVSTRLLLRMCVPVHLCCDTLLLLTGVPVHYVATTLSSGDTHGDSVLAVRGGAVLRGAQLGLRRAVGAHRPGRAPEKQRWHTRTTFLCHSDYE